MRLEYDRSTVRPIRYTMYLEPFETRNWARWPMYSWPCSVLKGKSLWVEVTTSGLLDIKVGGRRGNQDCPSDELCAMVGDFLPPELRHLWPVWEVKKPGTDWHQRGLLLVRKATIVNTKRLIENLIHDLERIAGSGVMDGLRKTLQELRDALKEGEQTDDAAKG